MPNVLALSSESQNEPTPQTIDAALAAIPDEVTSEPEPLPGQEGQAPGQTPPIVMMQPWALVDVSWVMPFADMMVKLPYEQAAKATHDDCWILTDDQIELINPALENAVKWVTWRFGAANAIGHPLTALAVAVGTLTAAKYGMYRFHQHQEREGAPRGQRNESVASAQRQGPRPGPRQGPQQPTPMDTSTTNGRMEESEGGSSFVASQGAAKVTSSKKEFVVVAE